MERGRPALVEGGTPSFPGMFQGQLVLFQNAAVTVNSVVDSAAA